MKKNVITSAILLAIPALAAAEDVAKLDVINVYSASATPTEPSSNRFICYCFNRKRFCTTWCDLCQRRIENRTKFSREHFRRSWHIN